MFIVGNFIGAVAYVLDTLLSIYMWVIIIDALLSWVRPDPYNPIVRFLHAATEPVLRPIRRLVGFRIGVDISPLIAILGIMFIRRFLVQSLLEMSMRM